MDLTLKIAGANVEGRHGPNQSGRKLSKLTKLLSSTMFGAGD